jgi:DNA-binding NarL/FixJ family response regulator
MTAADAPLPRPVTVLVVDDDERFRSLACGLLEADGYDVVGEAGTAVAGVALARRLRPDVVVLDLVMPEIDLEEVRDDSDDEVVINLVSAEESGLRAAVQLMGDDEPPEIVMVSSIFDPTVELRARQIGVSYLDKVSGLDALERAIEDRLRWRVNR